MQVNTAIPTDDIINWRRTIHAHPELSFQENHTVAYLTTILQSFPNLTISHPTPTSIMAVLHGKGPGKTIMFRADIDALPVPEETGLSYASQVPGISHACGHDAHAAMLLGTIAVLCQKTADFTGTIKFVFQHAEELIPGGALDIIAAGVLNDVQAFFGMHIIPNLPTGMIGLLPVGAASTANDAFFLTIQGKGTHGSMPQFGIDPILVGSEIVLALNTIVSRNITPGEMAVLSLGEFQAGQVFNVIPDTARLSGSIRSVTPEGRALLETRIRQVIEHTCAANLATYTLDYQAGYPAINNDPDLMASVTASARKIVGEEHVSPLPRPSASDDFGHYGTLAPQYYFILGGGLAQDGYGYANHHPKFQIDEKALPIGTAVQVQILLDYLQ